MEASKKNIRTAFKMKLITFLLATFLAGAISESSDSIEAFFEDDEHFAGSDTFELDQAGCYSWPAELKTLRECCVLPEAVNFWTVKGCRQTCSAQGFLAGMNCVVDCFVGKTGILQDGVFNKTVAAGLYKTYYNQWERIIKDGANQCNYNPSGQLEGNLARYFDCVDDYLSQNCVHFVESRECEAVQERFDTCDYTPQNCDKWPTNLFLPAFCCEIPKIYPEATPKCKSQCSKTELFYFKRKQCEKACTQRETGLVTESGTINFTLAETLLTQNLNKTDQEKWTSTVKYAIAKCEAELEGNLKVVSRIFYNLCIPNRVQQRAAQNVFDVEPGEMHQNQLKQQMRKLSPRPPLPPCQALFEEVSQYETMVGIEIRMAGYS